MSALRVSDFGSGWTSLSEVVRIFLVSGDWVGPLDRVWPIRGTHITIGV